MTLEISPVKPISRRRFVLTALGATAESTLLVNSSPTASNILAKSVGLNEPIVKSGLNILSGASKAVEVIATSTPSITHPSSDTHKYAVYPGSLEDKALKSLQEQEGPEAGLKFIDPKHEGPLGLIKAVIFSKYNSEMLELTKRLIASQWEQIQLNGRSSGSELYLRAYRESLAYLKHLQATTSLVRPDTNLLVEADHRANYAVAAAAAPHYSTEQAKLLGIVPGNAPANINIPQWFFRKDGYGRKGNPIIYGVENSEIDIVDGEPFEQGSERWGHLVYHAFFAASYKYFKEINHPLKNSLPLVMRAGLSYVKNKNIVKTIDQEALFLSEFMGWLYEVKTTIGSEDEQWKKSLKAYIRRFGIGNYYTSEGLLDTRVKEDVWANALGASLGVHKLNAILRGEDPELIIGQIDEPKFKWTGDIQPHLIPIGAAA